MELEVQSAVETGLLKPHVGKMQTIDRFDHSANSTLRLAMDLSGATEQVGQTTQHRG
jgi:hypothetical protein